LGRAAVTVDAGERLARSIGKLLTSLTSDRVRAGNRYRAAMVATTSAMIGRRGGDNARRCALRGI